MRGHEVIRESLLYMGDTPLVSFYKNDLDYSSKKKLNGERVYTMCGDVRSKLSSTPVLHSQKLLTILARYSAYCIFCMSSQLLNIGPFLLHIHALMRSMLHGLGYGDGHGYGSKCPTC